MQLSIPELLQPLCMALNWPCKNGSCYSAKASYYTRVPKWLKPFLHEVMSAMLEWLKPFRHSTNATGHARMAQAIMALKYCWQCQIGTSHSCTQVMCNWPGQNGSSHYGTQILYLGLHEPFWHLIIVTGKARMA